MLAITGAVVLAGGGSSRMGVCKSRLPMCVRGRWLPAATGLARMCERAGLSVVISRRAEQDNTWLEHPVALDEHVQHPLSGVVAGMNALKLGPTARVLILPCDIRLSAAGLGQFLAAPHRAHCARRLPLLAVLPLAIYPMLVEGIARGDSVRRVFADMPKTDVPTGFFHMNTPDEFHLYRSRCACSAPILDPSCPIRWPKASSAL